MFSLRTGFALRISFHTNTTAKCTRARFILCQGLLKQSSLTLQLVIRQQDQEFYQKCILPVNKAAVAVSDKLSSRINYYKCHTSHHYPNTAFFHKRISFFRLGSIFQQTRRSLTQADE